MWKIKTNQLKPENRIPKPQSIVTRVVTNIISLTVLLKKITKNEYEIKIVNNIHVEIVNNIHVNSI